MTQAELLFYWMTSAREDWATALDLVKLKRYTQGLFYVHIALEKYLKALITKQGRTPPHDHNLIGLAKIAGVNLDPDELTQLTEINTFNIRARYDDYRRSFHERATQSYTETYLDHATKFQTLWDTQCQ